MNASFIRAKNSAHRMIRKNGALLVWTRPGREDFDDVTGEPIPGTGELTQSLWTVILPPKYKGQEDQYKGEDGTLDLSKVRNVLVSTIGMGWTLKDLDRVTINGEQWVFRQATDLEPDAQTLILVKGILWRM